MHLKDKPEELEAALLKGLEEIEEKRKQYKEAKEFPTTHGFCVKCEVVSVFEGECDLDHLSCPHCGNWESLYEQSAPKED